MTFQDAFKIALDIGNTIRKQYEAIFDKEFTSDHAIQGYLKSLHNAV